MGAQHRAWVFTVRMWVQPEGCLGTLSDKPADAQPWGHLPAGPLLPLGDLFSGGLRVRLHALLCP